MSSPRLQLMNPLRPAFKLDQNEVGRPASGQTAGRFATGRILTWALMGSLLLCGCKQSRTPPPIPLPELSEAYEEVREFLTLRRRAVEENVDSGVAWGQYALALDAHEYTDDAIQCYRVAARLDSEQSRWKYLLAIKLRVRSPEKAETLLANITQRLGTGLAELLCHADVLTDLGRSKTADEVLAKAVTAHPSHPAVIFRLARRAFEDGKLDEASRHLDALPVDFRESSRLQMQLATRRNLSIPVPPPDSSPRNDLPSVDETIPDPYMAAVFRQRRDPLWTGKQAAERASRGDSIAYETLKGLVRRHPELEGNRLQLAMLMAAREGGIPAEEIVRQGLEISPESTRLLSGLAALSILKQDWKTSQQRLHDLLAIAPESAAGWSDMGFVLENMEEWNESIAAYDKALSLMPNDVELADRREIVRRKKKEADSRNGSLP